MKVLAEFLNDEKKNYKLANYTVIVDFDSFNIFYCIINRNYIVKMIYSQYEKGINIKQYEIQQVDNDTLSKLNNLIYSSPNAYIPSKKKAGFVLRVLQRNIARTNNPKRFEINKMINKFILKEV